MSDSVYLDVGFETFLNHVFGRDRYHGFAGNHEKTSWKKTLTKLFDSLERHVKVNIQDDPEQIRKIEQDLELIRDTLRRNESINELCIDSIRVLFEICFQLLGDEINHTDRRRLNRSAHYKLDKKRTLVYHSNNRQKFWKIHERAGTGQFLDAGVPNKIELEDFFFDELNNNADRFIEWFKERYPGLYLEMF